MVDVLIRNVPQEVLEVIKKRAKLHRRSLQQELTFLLSENARMYISNHRKIAERIRKQLQSSPDRVFSNSAKLIREDRDR